MDIKIQAEVFITGEEALDVIKQHFKNKYGVIISTALPLFAEASEDEISLTGFSIVLDKASDAEKIQNIEARPSEEIKKVKLPRTKIKEG